MRLPLSTVCAMIIVNNQTGRRGVVAPAPALYPTPEKEVAGMESVYSGARAWSSHGGRFSFGTAGCWSCGTPKSVAGTEEGGGE